MKHVTALLALMAPKVAAQTYLDAPEPVFTSNVSPPAIGNECAFSPKQVLVCTGADGSVAALDPNADFPSKWSYVPADTSGPATSSSGVSFSADFLIFGVTIDGNGCRVDALDANTGVLRWKSSELAGACSGTPVLSEDGRYTFVTHNPAGGSGGAFTILQDDQIFYEFSDDQPLSPPGITFRPAFGNYVGGEGNINDLVVFGNTLIPNEGGVSSDSQSFAFQFPIGFGGTITDNLGVVVLLEDTNWKSVRPPVFSEAGTKMHWGVSRGDLLAWTDREFSRDIGGFRISLGRGDPPYQPINADIAIDTTGTTLFSGGAGNGFYSLAALDLSESWAVDTISPVYAKGLLSPDETRIYVIEQSGLVRSIDAATGDVFWTMDASVGSIVAGFAQSASGSTIYFVDFSGILTGWKVADVAPTAMIPIPPPSTAPPTGASPANQPIEDKSELTSAITLFTSNNANDVAAAIEVYGNISFWDVSAVTDMSGLFQDQEAFNEDISAWNVSNVIDMSFMFHSASSFDMDISRWDVSRVLYMRFMFQDATSFTGTVGSSTERRLGYSSSLIAPRECDGGSSSAADQLDCLATFIVSSVIDATGMFLDATSFNGDISRWDVKSLTKADRMFQGASAFNQDLCRWGADLKRNRASVHLMFDESGCDFTATPDLTATTPNPLCRCCSVCGSCFSGVVTVETKNNRTMLMQDLKIGDYVKVGQDSFERVYSFGHYKQDSKQKFLVFNHDLVVSPEHMIAVAGRGFIPAGDIKRGEILVTGDESPVQIYSINLMTSSGMFAPFTPSGKLLVNGYLVSSFVAMQQDTGVLKIGGFSTGLTFHWLAHTFEFPHRLVCYYLGRCPQERYSELGISKWVEKPFELTTWWLDQSVPVMMLILSAVSIVLIVFVLLEMLMINPQWLMVLSVLGACAWKKRRAEKAKCKTE